MLGEHNREILMEELGLSEERMAELKELKIV
jgi:crotonobetainyl-CoA:carnitine CoA-transferase CaiB-like acyl-CoA transferase